MIPPKIKGNWLLYYLIIVPVTYLVVKHMYQPDITLGDIIVLATTIPALVIGTWKVIEYIKYNLQPFKLEYQKERVWRGNKRHTFSNLTLPLGISKFLIRVRPNRPTVFKRIHLRLLDEKNVKATFPSKETIYIDDVAISGEGLLYPLEGMRQDDTNGIQGNFQEEWECASEESLFLEITVNVIKPWKGYLMFQSHREDKHRGYGYLYLEGGT